MLEAAVAVRERKSALFEVEVALDRGEWPPGSFEDDVAEVAGVHARAVSVSSLRADNAVVRDDESVAAKDRADFVTREPLPG
jgi:hypothetical protein